MRRTVRGTRARIVFLVLMLAAMIVVGCNALLDFDSFKYNPTGSEGGSDGSPDGDTTDGGGDGGCVDPTGFGGKGCYRCTPTTNDQLLNACTPSKFEAFDNQARIKDFSAADAQPPLPLDAGPGFPPFDAGSSTSTGVDGGTTCPFTSVPNPVLVLGATGFPMEVIAQAMGPQVTMFYKETGSCLGIGTMVKNIPKYSSTDIVAYYDSNGAKLTCTVSTVGDDFQADVALSALFAESCAGAALGGGETLPDNVTLPAGVQDFLGPANPVMLATPATSTQRVISAEAAYRIYGFGTNDGVPLAKGVEPWTDETFIFRRTSSSGNQQTVARSLGLPLNGLRGRDSTGSSAMLRAIRDSVEPQKTLGISSSEIVDINRTSIKALAYQHYGQNVGFYPDSDPGQFDRRNVRDGHYFLWIPLHVLVRTNAGDPIAINDAKLIGGSTTQMSRDAAVRSLVYVMVSRQEPVVKSVSLFNALKVVGNIPQCAMRVTRTKEAAPLEPFKPSTSCACAFEAASPGAAPADCKQCTGPTECAGSNRPTCSFGFCE